MDSFAISGKAKDVFRTIEKLAETESVFLSERYQEGNPIRMKEYPVKRCTNIHNHVSAYPRIDRTICPHCRQFYVDRQQDETT